MRSGIELRPRPSLAIALFAACLVGCVPVARNSLALGRPDADEFVASLLGDWYQVDPKFGRMDDSRIYRIKRQELGSNEYKLCELENGVPRRTWEHLRLVRIAETDFLDVACQLDLNRDPFHLIWRVRRNGNCIAFDGMSDKYLMEHATEIAHETSMSSWMRFVTVTASTQDLRRFVLMNANNENAWVKSGIAFTKIPLKPDKSK
jgi:hypothetical protein